MVVFLLSETRNDEQAYILADEKREQNLKKSTRICLIVDFDIPDLTKNMMCKEFEL